MEVSLRIEAKERISPLPHTHDNMLLYPIVIRCIGWYISIHETQLCNYLVSKHIHLYVMNQDHIVDLSTRMHIYYTVRYNASEKYSIASWSHSIWRQCQSIHVRGWIWDVCVDGMHQNFDTRMYTYIFMSSYACIYAHVYGSMVVSRLDVCLQRSFPFFWRILSGRVHIILRNCLFLWLLEPLAWSTTTSSTRCIMSSSSSIIMMPIIMVPISVPVRSPLSVPPIPIRWPFTSRLTSLL